MELLLRYPGWIFLISVIVIFIVSVIIYRHIRKMSTMAWIIIPGMTFFSGIAFGIVLFIVSISLHSIPLESRVDVSPLERLTNEHTEFVEDMVLQLREEDPAAFGGIRSWKRTSVSWLTIGVTIFDDEAQAIERMDRRRPSTGIPVQRNQRYREMVNDNQTQAILLHCTNNYSLPSPERYFRSYVRIGNAVFHLYEVRPRHDLDNNYSSQFIVWFVELLEEAYSENMN